MRYEVFTERAGDSWSSQFPDVPEALVRTRHHDRIELTARAVIAQALAPPESFEVDVSSYDNLGGKAVNSRTGIAEKNEAPRPGTSSGTLQRLGETLRATGHCARRKVTRRGGAATFTTGAGIRPCYGARASVGCSSNRRDR